MTRPRAFILATTAILSILAAPRALAQNGEAASETNQIVAKVNKAIITRRDVEREIWDFLQALQSDPLKSGEEKVREYQFNFLLKLREMISEMLTAQLGRESGITISEELVEARIRQRADELEGLPRLVEVLSERGMTLDDLRDSIEEDAIVQEMLFAGAGLRPVEDLEIPPLDTFVGPGEVWDYYQKNQNEFRAEAAIKISMILTSKRKHGARARARAEEAHRKLLGGASFATLAGEYSDHRSTAKYGGKLNDGEWMAPGENIAEIEEVIWGLPGGGISGIVESRAAFLIVRVDERQDATVGTFADVQDRVKMRLQEARLRENFGRIQRILFENAYVWPESLLADERQSR